MVLGASTASKLSILRASGSPGYVSEYTADQKKNNICNIFCNITRKY